MSIELVNLEKHYRDAGRDLVVIESLSLKFPEQGSVAVMGKSGVGKSTLLYLLGGLDRPNSGGVLHSGVDITSLPPDELARFRGENIGFIFQFHHLLAEFSAAENVAFPLILAGRPESEALAEAHRLLERVGLAARSEHRPAELSGGEQQRVAIARAVIARPRVLLADEPTGDLDAATAMQVQQLLHEINRECGSLMVVVTHNTELARSMDVTLEMLPGGALERR